MIKQIFSILGIILVAVISLSAILYMLLDVTNGEINSGGKVRRYLLHLPEGYDPAIPAPLVISLHGFAEWPGYMQWVTGWNDLADEVGFVVVYPAGTGFPKRWHNTMFGGGIQKQQADIDFIAELIDHLSGKFNLDKKRVYVNGFSNGGGLAHMLACVMSDRIAAVAGISGTYVYPSDHCKLTRAVPMVVFHGTEDPRVPYNGGVISSKMIPLPDVPTWVAGWARLNGCSQVSRKPLVPGEVDRIVYKDCDQETEVQLYTILGGRHSWPGKGYLPAFLVSHIPKEINATKVIWDFFSIYSIPES